MRLTEDNPLKNFTSLKYTSKKPIYLDYKKDNTKTIEELLNKLGQLEDIEERLFKYKEVGIDGLVDLFKNLTDEDIEYIVQLALNKNRVVYTIRH